MTRTDNQALIGIHKFEAAGLGKAPFRFQGVRENLFRTPDGHCKPGGSCDYCGTGIRDEFWLSSADGQQFKVGCDCIRKAGDKGLLQAYKSSPEFRAKQAAKRQADRIKATAELNQLIADNADKLRAIPHPQGFINRKTNEPLTGLDWAIWMQDHCGLSGKKAIIRRLKQILK